MRGKVGVWLYGARLTDAGEEREQLRRIDRLGYESAWIGEQVGGKDAMARSAIALAATERLTIGTGIANLWARPAPTMQAGGRTLAEAFPGRFVLGIGIGHPFQAESLGEQYRKPLTLMKNYLSRMDEEAALNPPARPFRRVLGAIGPKMLALSRDAADGAHPFFMPLAHTVSAREILGPDKLLVPHQTVLLEPDPRRAREIARPFVRFVLTEGASAYPKAWRDFGYDLDGTSDRLVDAAVAWGDEEAIAKRVREQLDAGADQVLITPLADTLTGTADQLERLAPALLG
ncbi:TIGR03620 family F420-dependent LLM class oxidoreductase [Amycolatopsis acidicola]|uniref:TIGR03620 family F420-dependent LLM class oxidoreductase n=1 Tax=Amycolatopsis acidicola TaxID=2596893 RepID=A0A5N0V2W2_9PSEU|nr:TIGR03620 family F420-dependent LLM class oxidoreductase [Amycolatopsis acidicola]KAA9159469.1 TIGR03620 family F420-dependent LLM class oxidoreductase [Amycolatopsis acidicola]